LFAALRAKKGTAKGIVGAEMELELKSNTIKREN